MTNEPGYFEEGRELAEKGWIGDAGAWITDDDDRVLLIRHCGTSGQWGTPGGGHEPGESLEETARREVGEETGVDCSLTGVVRARRRIVVHEDDADARFYMLTVEFEGDYEGGDIDVGDEEILDVRWFAEPPAAIDDFLTPKVEAWANGV